MVRFMGEVHKVKKESVHKDVDDDVIVCNERGGLPAWLEAESLDFNLLSHDDAAFLKQYYRSSLDAEDAGPARLYLKSVLPRISKASLSRHKTTPEFQQILASSYREEGDDFLLAVQHLDEHGEHYLLRFFGIRDCHVRAAERVRLSAILEQLPTLTRQPVSYLTLFNDANNYFFYRKHHEHVPGVMLIEAARQAMYVHYYKYSGVKRGEVSLSILTMNSEFKNYANTNYPVYLKVEDIPASSRSESHKSIQELEKKVGFYQSNKLIATISMRYVSIKMALFKSMREVEAIAAHRFIPLKNITDMMFLSDTHGSEHECKLGDISRQGFQVVFRNQPKFNAQERFDFLFFVEKVGFINGSAELVWSKAVGTGLHAGLRITEMSKSVIKKLDDTIKNFTHVNVEREIL